MGQPEKIKKKIFKALIFHMKELRKKIQINIGYVKNEV
jgi:hypothetical protein